MNGNRRNLFCLPCKSISFVLNFLAHKSYKKKIRRQVSFTYVLQNFMAKVVKARSKCFFSANDIKHKQSISTATRSGNYKVALTELLFAQRESCRGY